MADKLDDFDRRDLDQNKVINRQRQENEKLRGQVTQISQELQDIEAHSAEADRELDRIKQLGGKLQTDVETRRVGAREVQEIMAQVEALKNKEGMDPRQFEQLKSQVEDQIKDFRTKGVNPEKFAELTQRLDAMSQADQVDRNELARVQDLVGKVETGQREIETGRIDVAAKLADLEKRQDDIEQREKNIDKEIDAKVVQAAVRAGRRGTQAEYKRSKNRLDKLENEVLPQLAQAEEALKTTIDDIIQHDNLQDQAIRDLSQGQVDPGAAKRVAHPQALGSLDQWMTQQAANRMYDPEDEENRVQYATESVITEAPGDDYVDPESITPEENKRVAFEYANKITPILYGILMRDPNKRDILRRYSSGAATDAIFQSSYHWLFKIGAYAIRDEYKHIWRTTLEILVAQHPYIEHDDLGIDPNKIKGLTKPTPKGYGKVVPPRVPANPEPQQQRLPFDDGNGTVKESSLPKKYTQAIDDMAAQILGDQYGKYLT